MTLTSATRPPLPVRHQNAHLKDVDSRGIVVKYQSTGFRMFLPVFD
jgi:hypothetical protein